MAAIDEVLERLVTEPAFKERLARDPKEALAGYQLTADDLALLATQVTGEAGGFGPVEQRTSKAGFFALFSDLVHGGGGGGGASTDDVGIIDDGKNVGLGGPDTDDAGIIVIGSQPDPSLGGGTDDAGIIIVGGQPDPALGGSSTDDAGIIIIDNQPDPGLGETGMNLTPAEDTGTKYTPGEDTGVNFTPAEDTGTKYTPGEDAGLNFTPAEDTGSGGPEAPGSHFRFNPQPEPPGDPAGDGMTQKVADQ